jgi:hypothetical protein
MVPKFEAVLKSALNDIKKEIPQYNNFRSAYENYLFDRCDFSNENESVELHIIANFIKSDDKGIWMIQGGVLRDQMSEKLFSRNDDGSYNEGDDDEYEDEDE